MQQLLRTCGQYGHWYASRWNALSAMKRAALRVSICPA